MVPGMPFALCFFRTHSNERFREPLPPGMGYGFGKVDKASLDKNRLRKVEAKEKGALGSDQQKYVTTVLSWCNRQLELNESELRISSIRTDFQVLSSYALIDLFCRAYLSLLEWCHLPHVVAIYCGGWPKGSLSRIVHLR